MTGTGVFLLGTVWLAGLLMVSVALFARARTTAERILVLDLAALVLIGLLALVAAEDRRSYALDAGLALALLSFVATLAAARYLGDHRPFDQPRTDPEEGTPE